MPKYRLKEVIAFKWDPATLSLDTLPDGLANDKRFSLDPERPENLILTPASKSIVPASVCPPGWYACLQGTTMWSAPAMVFESQYEGASA